MKKYLNSINLAIEKVYKLLNGMYIEIINNLEILLINLNIEYKMLITCEKECMHE